MASLVSKALETKKKKPKLSLAEKAVALQSRAVYGVLASIGFFAISMMIMSSGEKLWFLAPMALSFVCLAGALSRFVQARGYKKLATDERYSELPDAREEFPPLARSLYATDELGVRHFSVTERTTNLLKREDEN